MRRVITAIICTFAISSFAQVQPRALQRVKILTQENVSTDIELQVGTTYSSANCGTPKESVGNCKVGSAGCTWSSDTPWPFSDVGLDPGTGCMAGTATTPEAAKIPITALDTSGHRYHGSFNVTVKPGIGSLSISNPILASQPENIPYSEQLMPSGGTPPYTWAFVSGSLPAGLHLVSGNGLITGSPTASGTSTFQVQLKDSTGASTTQTVTVQINPAPDCANPKYDNGRYFNGFIPLSLRKNIDPLGTNNVPRFPTENDVVCFYGASNVLAPLTQVQYLYGFGQGTNTLSADMVSFQIPAPFALQTSLGTSVTGGGNTNTPNGQPTGSAALASLEAGGNFYIHFVYPLFVYTSKYFTSLNIVNSKFGFSFNGFAGQSTLSQGTEQYFSLPFESYAQLTAIQGLGGFYADYRGGLQTVPGHFKVATGLPSNAFGLQQLSGGITFKGLFRIGAQRYFGPSAGFNAPNAINFHKWYLVIQLSPAGS